MSLRKRTLITLGQTIIGLMLLLSLVISLIITENYERLEVDQTKQHVKRAMNAIERDIDALKLTIQSWAAWDNSREFILGERPDYPSENNLTEQITTTLRLNMLLFFDVNNHMIYGLAADLVGAELKRVPASIQHYLNRNQWLLSHDDPRDGYTGVVLLPEGPLLMVAQPISSSNYDSIVGTLVAARYIDAMQVERLQHITELEIAVFRWDSHDLLPHVQQARSALIAGADIVVYPLTAQHIAGYTLWRDFDHQPAFLLQVITPRPIHQAGQTALVALLVALLIAGVTFSGITLLITERLVLARLSQLSSAVVAISENHLTRLELKPTDNDELGQLGAAINCMLETVEQAHRREQIQSERARQQIEMAHDLKTKFIANMSHELRTPLNAIINFTYIIRSGLRGPLTDEQISYLDRIYASSEHLLGLINDILDLAKIEAGRMDLYLESLHLGELVESTMSTAIGLTKDKPISLHYEQAENLPLIAVDRTRIRQVLLNLLSNAARFTDRGQITVRVWQQGHELITSITDTGIGIPIDKQEIIFEEFRQADEGSARSYQGTGLGLPICKRLIELHGGRIWVESTVGVGSTFFFSLPLPAVPMPAPTSSRLLKNTPSGVGGAGYE